MINLLASILFNLADSPQEIDLARELGKKANERPGEPLVLYGEGARYLEDYRSFLVWNLRGPALMLVLTVSP